MCTVFLCLTDAIALRGAFFGRGGGNILMDNVACVGTESRLDNCSYDFTHNCYHFEDAGVICKRMCVCVEGGRRRQRWVCERCICGGGKMCVRRVCGGRGGDIHVRVE